MLFCIGAEQEAIRWWPCRHRLVRVGVCNLALAAWGRCSVCVCGVHAGEMVVGPSRCIMEAL